MDFAVARSKFLDEYACVRLGSGWNGMPADFLTLQETARGATLLRQRLAGITFDAVAGIRESGAMLGQFIAERIGAFPISLCCESHDFVCHVNIPTTVRDILLVTHRISTGEAEVRAVQVLREKLLMETRITVAALVNEMHGGREALERVNCELHEVFVAGELYARVAQYRAPRN